MKKKWKITIVIAIAVFILLYIAFVVFLLKGPSTGARFGKNSIALISINGVIASSEDGSFSQAATPENILGQLEQAQSDPAVAVVLLRINSPGGTAAASQEIFTEIKRFKKPVVVSIGDIGASGAYWIASGADKILANGVSEVGSIGVIISIPNIKGLLDKAGAELQIIKKGKFKDLGSPSRPLTEEEKKILSDHSEIIYQEFISSVAKSRQLEQAKVESLATGLTFPGSEARKMGLIDEIGNLNDAIRAAGKLGGIKGKPNIVRYDEPGIFDFFKKFPGVNMSLNSMINGLRKPDNSMFYAPLAN